MKIKEIRDKQTSALHLELKDLQKNLFDLRTQAVTEKLEDPSQLRKRRKEIARFKTILRERELEEAKGKTPATETKAVKQPKKSATHAAKAKAGAKAIKSGKANARLKRVKKIKKDRKTEATAK